MTDQRWLHSLSQAIRDKSLQCPIQHPTDPTKVTVTQLSDKALREFRKLFTEAVIYDFGELSPVLRNAVADYLAGKLSIPNGWYHVFMPSAVTTNWMTEHVLRVIVTNEGQDVLHFWRDQGAGNPMLRNWTVDRIMAVLSGNGKITAKAVDPRDANELGVERIRELLHIVTGLAYGIHLRSQQ